MKQMDISSFYSQFEYQTNTSPFILFLPEKISVWFIQLLMFLIFFFLLKECSEMYTVYTYTEHCPPNVLKAKHTVISIL